MEVRLSILYADGSTPILGPICIRLTMMHAFTVCCVFLQGDFEAQDKNDPQNERQVQYSCSCTHVYACV